MHTMHAPDEVLDRHELEVPEPSRPPGEREVAMAQALVGSLDADFDPGRYRDTYRERVRELVERKAKGEPVEAQEPPAAPHTGDDLLAALQASVEAVQKGAARWPCARSGALAVVRPRQRPVSLVPAVRDLDVRFHQLHAATHARLEVRRVCTKEEREVAYEDIGHGVQLDDGRQVVLIDAELDAAAREKTRTIDISEFVDVAAIDPVFYDHACFLVPDDQGEGPARAYRLLVETMRGSGRAALGQFVLRTREHVVAIRVRDDLLQLTTMVFADEVRPTDELPLPGAEHAPSDEEVRNAVALVEELSRDFDPERYRDRHRDRLLAIIERKRRGETIHAPAEPETPKAVPDLLRALEQSLADVRGRRERAPVGD